MRWEREGGWEAAERDLKAALGALGRTYGVLWMVVSAGLVIAAWRYGRGDLLLGRLGAGVTLWGLVFVALPAYRRIAGLYRLHDAHCGGPTREVLNHRWLAGLTAAVSAYTSLALWAGWPAGLLVAACPAACLWSCLSVGSHSIR